MQGEFRADVSRDTFDASKQFSRVFLQQGRVQLDADWNEQGDIFSRYLRSLAADLIGPHGGNAAVAGFNLITTEAEIDNLKGESGNNLPADTVKSLKEALRASGFLIGAGRYYVDGTLCINESNEGFIQQAGYPFELNLPLDQIRETTGPYMIFLDVWERHISSFDDVDITEVALGGAETASRAQVVTSVFVLPPKLGDVTFYDQVQLSTDITTLKNAITANNDTDIRNARQTLLASAEATRKRLSIISKASMRARARVSGMPEGDCNIQPEAQYRGPENQLYRIEIHRSGVAWDGVTDRETPAGNANSAATFKWSRENGSLAFPILSLNSDLVRISSPGRDATRSLNVDDWVEVVDDNLTLKGESGPLRRIKSINPDDLTVTLNAPVDLSYDENSTVHPQLRRWDQRKSDGSSADNALLVTEATGEDPIDWITLEDGVQIQFPKATGNSYRAGDYWLVPARVATGDVLWPRKIESKVSVAKALPPHGIEHHYAPLAIVSIDNQNFILEQDCRRVFDYVAVI